MNKLVYLLLLSVLISCKGEEQSGITKMEIEAYVADKMSDSQEYDVSQSLRFSRENETYEVVRYMQNDTVILYLETEVKNDGQVVRQTFYKQGIAVYVDELIMSNKSEEEAFKQRLTYLDGSHIIESEQRSATYEIDLEYLPYKSTTADFSEFNFNRPDSAMLQIGNYEMKFEEFIVIDPQTYLILENPISDYDVALFVTEDHPLLTTIVQNQKEYKGKSIFVTHQFVLMNNVERMLFIDGYLTNEVNAEN